MMYPSPFSIIIAPLTLSSVLVSRYTEALSTRQNTNNGSNSSTTTLHEQNTTDQEWWLKDVLITVDSFTGVVVLSAISACAYKGANFVYQHYFNKSQKTAQTKDIQFAGQVNDIFDDEANNVTTNPIFNPFTIDDIEVTGDTATPTSEM